jgi:hypothetical protein
MLLSSKIANMRFVVIISALILSFNTFGQEKETKRKDNVFSWYKGISSKEGLLQNYLNPLLLKGKISATEILTSPKETDSFFSMPIYKPEKEKDDMIIELSETTPKQYLNIFEAVAGPKNK